MPLEKQTAFRIDCLSSIVLTSRATHLLSQTHTRRTSARPINMRHQPTAFAAAASKAGSVLTWLFLFLHLLGLQAVPSLVGADDLTGDGCGLGKYPRLWQLMKEEQKPDVPFGPLPPNPAPVQGLHLSYEGSKALRVTWMSPAPPTTASKEASTGRIGVKGSSVCRYGSSSVSQFLVSGTAYTYSAGMFNHTLNTAVLDVSALPCAASAPPCVKNVVYQCGDSALGFSEVQQVQVQNETAPSTPGPQFAVVGDMGVPHGLKTIAAIARRLKPAGDAGSRVEMLLHAGDISYANHYDNPIHNNSWVWVDYMNGLQPVAARVPYMTAPGNHEAEFDFAAYLNWLPMPSAASGSSSPFWFSFDYIGVHVLAYSTEHDFSQNSTQYQWMVQDLVRANQNRARVPWVLVMGHRPLYCSSIICRDRCHDQAPVYRSYLEELLNQQRVDVVIAGHNHQYERSYPVYKQKPTQKDYVNPKAPVYIVDGGAGCPELNDPTFEPFVDWRANDKASFATGFLLMTPTASELKFDYVMSDTSEIFDSFTIVRK